MKKRGSLDQVGLRLSRHALRVLKERGIFVQSAVSLEPSIWQSATWCADWSRAVRLGTLVDT